ncbi:hypothetical protein [Parachitinimonas caeni]|uniref:Phosphoglycerate mutase n=1 Tax=Parachitinimonas caeni TaxID=3031301 RepID=A0ABT7E1K8_9NEIS|nr:hypothetical protein [Parachitinimonas caeni]MDK2126201.1 hypothetical protein [Parachitinimonas caeni]
MLVVAIPHLILPPIRGYDPTAELKLPALDLLLGRGQARIQAGQRPLDWLLQQFGAPDLSVATLLRPEATPESGKRWLCAAPIHLRPERDQLIASSDVYTDLTSQETEALLASLNRHFNQDGIQFVASTPDTWFVQLPVDEKIDWAPLDLIAGASIHPHLPKGEGALRWHAFLNEVQMLLYTHPVNDAREQRGLLPVSSIWPWGDGRVDSPITTRFGATYGDAPILRALASRAGVVAQPLKAAEGPIRSGLLWLDGLTGAAAHGDIHGWQLQLQQIESAYLQPIVAAWRKGDILALQLHAPSAQGTCVASLRPADRWKFWRGPLPLRQLKIES